MKIPAIFLSLFCFAANLPAQIPGDYRSTTYSSVNDWKTVNSWEKFITYPDYWLTPTQVPSFTQLGANVTILSYVDLDDNLGFQNSNITLQVGDGAINTPNDPYKVSDYKVLVIRGDVDISNQKPKIVIKENGIMIILGNLVMGNKTELENDGFLVVDGSLTFGAASGKATYIASDDSFLFLPDGPLDVTQPPNDAFDVALDFPQLCGESAIPGYDPNTDPRRDILPAICTFIETGGANPLPVRLSSFSAVVEGNAVQLEWQTASETNNDYFTIARSFDGINYMMIGEVSGNGTTNEPHSYEFTDFNPGFGMQYYRLTQTDFDGSIEILGDIPVDFSADLNGLSVYPNPVTDKDFTIRLTGLESNKSAIIRISDLSGRLLYSGSFISGPGGHLLGDLNAAVVLSRGSYIISVSQGSMLFKEKIIKM